MPIIERLRSRATSGPSEGSQYIPVASAAGVGPASEAVAPRTPVLFTAGSLATGFAAAAGALVLVLVWLLVDPRTPDLAAQVYRTGLFERTGFAVWDEHWYAGHALPGYSLLFPPLAALLGLRTVAALSVLASAALFERLVIGVYGRRARWGAAWFAVAAVGDIWLGRLTFALGVTCAVAAVFALVRGHPRWAALAAALCAAASPVAAVLLGLAALTDALVRHSPRALLALALPAAVVAAPLALLFEEGGFEPFPIRSFAATVAVTLLFLWALPAGARLLRAGGLLYLLACVLALVLHTPLGSNIERYAVLLAGPLLLCVRLCCSGAADVSGLSDRLVARSSPSPLDPPNKSNFFSKSNLDSSTSRLGRAGTARISRVLAGGASRAALSIALLGIALFTLWGPVRETKAVAQNESTSAAYYAPVLRFLEHVQVSPAPLVRVEVPLTRSHWEAALMAPTVSLARGWEKQLEERYDGVLLEPGLTAAGYERWLHSQAVSYVALPDTTLDPSSAREGRLIRSGLSYLREVFRSRHWTVYEVRDPTPLLEGPGRLISLGSDSFALRARRPGRLLVRVRWTRFWTLASGSGHVAEAPGGWTYVFANQAGPQLRVAARFSLGRLLE